MSEKDLKNSFIKTFEETMKEKGFMRKSNIFHRIVNGKISQLVSYYKFYQAPIFTIQFSIRPLCAGLEYSTFMDASRISETFGVFDWEWEYEYQTDGFRQHMPMALEVTKEHLFPLFDLVIDYKGYLENMLLFDKLPIFSSQVYMTNMALGNYELSKESREDFMEGAIKTNQKNWGTDHHIIPERQAEFEKLCEEYYQIKKAMDNNDRETIEQYIHEQEQKSLKSYIKAFTTPKKYEDFLETGNLPFEFVYISDSEVK